MSTPVRSLDVKERPRTAEEAPLIEAKYNALNFIATRAGFPNYQQMTIHIWTRIVTRVSERVDAYAGVDAEIEEIVDKAVAGIEHIPKRPKP